MGRPIYAQEKSAFSSPKPKSDEQNPHRRLLNSQFTQNQTSYQGQVTVDDLEEMIIRQLRPRAFNLIFGNSDQDTTPSLEILMERLRRQVRSTAENENPELARRRQIFPRPFERVNDGADSFYRWNLIRRSMDTRTRLPLPVRQLQLSDEQSLSDTTFNDFSIQE